MWSRKRYRCRQISPKHPVLTPPVKMVGSTPMDPLPTYDRTKTYQWNYDHAPAIQSAEIAEVPGDFKFCGLPVDSPLGVPSGPLLNGKWCLYYASLGFDVVTYKTVRSGARLCYDLPNLQPVLCDDLHGGEGPLHATSEMHGSWAVSFGMGSLLDGVPFSTWCSVGGSWSLLNFIMEHY